VSEENQSAPRRIQLSRKRGWRMPPNTVSVARPGKWGNPFVIGKEFVRPKMSPGGGQIANVVQDNGHAVSLFRRFTAREARWQIDAIELRGKNLACWCRLDQPCHADVLLALANAPTSLAGEG